jgi:hypothetical protein
MCVAATAMTATTITWSHPQLQFKNMYISMY